jgi:hypothetical protein
MTFILDFNKELNELVDSLMDFMVADNISSITIPIDDNYIIYLNMVEAS